MPRTLYTHDNFNRPFKVIITNTNTAKNSTVEIYKITSYEPDVYDKLVKTYKNVNKVHIGRSTIGDHNKANAKYFIGNSILLELPAKKFVFIGHELYEFKISPKEVPVKFYSIVGNNDVPYPVFLTDTNAYMMLDHVMVPRGEFPIKTVWEDAYRPFIGVWDADQELWIGSLSHKARKMKGYKLLHSRI